MELVHFVKDEEAQRAKKMEEKLLRLPIFSGVLFVGVSVLPAKDDQPTVYQVWVGCSRDVDPKMIPHLVATFLREEVSQGYVIRTEAKMGTIRG
jgi:hypothetical protein